MPTDTNKKESMSVMERLAEKAVKTMEKATEQQTMSRLQNGQSPEQILQDLIGQRTEQLGFSPSGSDKAQALLTTLTGIPTPGFGRVASRNKMRSQAEDSLVKLLGLQQSLKKGAMEEQQLPMQQAKGQLDILNSLLDISKKEREGSFQFKQKEDLRSIKNAIDKENAVKMNKSAADSLAAIDAMQSLKQSFYEGFEPMSIEEATGKKLSEAEIKDIFDQKAYSISKIINARIGKNPQGAAFLRNLKSFSTLISRGGFQERGTLTDTDRKVVVQAFDLALSSKEDADVAWSTIESVLAKPSLRYAKMRISKFKETLEDVELPFNLKEKISTFREINPDISEAKILDYFINRTNNLGNEKE